MALDSNEKPAVKPDSPGADSTHTNAPSTEKEVNMGSNDYIDIVDLEEFAVAGKPVPPGKRYRIRIDKETNVVEVDHLTGRQILALVHKTPEKYLLRQRIHGGVKPVEPDEKVSFLEPGIERFMTIPHEVREGDGAKPRRGFALLKGDEAFLNNLGSRWEAVVDGGVNAVIIYDWPLPPGYNVAKTDVHVRFSSGYPDTQLDMAYFSPMLVRADRRGIGGLSEAGLDGRKWQQWSRHRTEASSWRSDIDDLGTHMALVDEWLAAELRK